MTPTDDVALPELSDEQKVRFEELKTVYGEGVAGIYLEGIAIGLADRARASERSTAEPVAEIAISIDDQSRITKSWQLLGELAPGLHRLYAIPPASDAALERAASRYSRTTIDAAKQIVREEFDRQPMLWKQPTPCRILDRLDALMQPTATDETTGERG